MPLGRLYLSPVSSLGLFWSRNLKIINTAKKCPACRFSHITAKVCRNFQPLPFLLRSIRNSYVVDFLPLRRVLLHPFCSVWQRNGFYISMCQPKATIYSYSKLELQALALSVQLRPRNGALYNGTLYFCSMFSSCHLLAIKHFFLI